MFFELITRKTDILYVTEQCSFHQTSVEYFEVTILFLCSEPFGGKSLNLIKYTGRAYHHQIGLWVTLWAPSSLVIAIRYLRQNTKTLNQNAKITWHLKRIGKWQEKRTSGIPNFTIGRWLTDGIMMLCKYNWICVSNIKRLCWRHVKNSVSLSLLWVPWVETWKTCESIRIQANHESSTIIS